MREMIKIGIIGGTGFYETNYKTKEKIITTPFGNVNVQISKYDTVEVAFITRHGKEHSIPPHLVNYRANIYALYSLGVDRVITSSAVGSMLPEDKPGTFILPDQFIDFTIGRPKTFFDGKFEIKLHSGKMLKGVVHTDLTTPYCSNLRDLIFKQGKQMNLSIKEKGVYVCTEGPRFETPAEISAFKILGGTIVGMTSVSECILARELGMCYATICLVTNHATGMQEKITAEEVFDEFKRRIDDLRKLIEHTIRILPTTQYDCTC